MELTVNLAGLPPEVAQCVIRGIQHEDRASYLLGLLEQRKAAQYAQAVAAAKYEGELRAKAIFSPNQAAMARRQYGELCFADPDWMPWYLKRPEGAEHRVKDAGSKIQVGWTAGSRRREEAESPSLPRGLHG